MDPSEKLVKAMDRPHLIQVQNVHLVWVGAQRPLPRPLVNRPFSWVRAEVDPGWVGPSTYSSSFYIPRVLLVFAINWLSRGTFHCSNSHVTLNFSTQIPSHHCCGCGLAFPKLLAEECLSKWENSRVVMKHAAKVVASFTKRNGHFHTFNKSPSSSNFHSILV